MIALVDTNVVLDVLLDRAPFALASASVLAGIESSRAQGLLCATTVTTIQYIAERSIGAAASRLRIGNLLAVFGVAPVNGAALEAAIASPIKDFEDAVLHESAIRAGADCIVTRNTVDFSLSQIPVYTPAQAVQAMA